MSKTKLRWEFPRQEEMHTIEVNDIQNIGLNGITTLRNCLHGYDEQGALRKVLYCTRDGRFFVRNKDGLREQMPNTNTVRRGNANRNAKGGGGFDTAIMRHFGNRRCYRLVAYAWCEWPAASTCDREWYRRYEVDHLDANHANGIASNLEWVTPQENKRRSKEVLKPLRKTGIDPKWLYTRNLKGIYRLEEAPLEYFLDRLPEVFAGDSSQLTIENINLAVATTLDETHDMTIYCSRCECAMIRDTEEHQLNSGECLCDCCYDEMFG